MRNRQQGMSLVSVVVGLALIGIMMLGLIRMLKFGFQGQRTISSRVDQDLVQDSIAAYIDCAATFSAAGIDPNNPGTQCQSTSSGSGGQVAPYLRIKRKNPSGPAIDLTDPLDSNGAAKFGKLYLRTTCSNSEKTLVIRTASVTEANPDFYGKDSLLFGKGYGAVPLCYASSPASQSLRILGSVANLTMNSPLTLSSINPDTGANDGSYYHSGYQDIPLSEPFPNIAITKPTTILMTISGHVSFNGCTVTDYIHAYFTFKYSLDGSAPSTRLKFNSVAFFNGGTSFHYTRKFALNGGETFRVTPEVNFEQKRTYRYTTGSWPNNCLGNGPSGPPGTALAARTFVTMIISEN